MERVVPDLGDTMRHAGPRPPRLAHGLRRRTGWSRRGFPGAETACRWHWDGALADPRASWIGWPGQLEALSPLKVLGRGYSVARLEDGRVVRRTADLPPGTAFDLTTNDGEIAAHAD